MTTKCFKFCNESSHYRPSTTLRMVMFSLLSVRLSVHRGQTLIGNNIQQVKLVLLSQLKVRWYTFFLPGHGSRLQPMLCLSSPGQYLPPPEGAGSLQLRVRKCFPFCPQVAVQVPTNVHSPQLPLSPKQCIEFIQWQNLYYFSSRIQQKEYIKHCLQL